MARLETARVRRTLLVTMVPVFAVAAGLGWLLAAEPAAAPGFCPTWAPPDSSVWQYTTGEGTGSTCSSACSAAQADAFASTGCSVCYHVADCACACEIGGGCSADFAMTYVCWVTW